MADLTKYTPEFQLMVAACGAYLHKKPLQIEDSIWSKIDWDKLIRLSAVHSILPQLYLSIQERANHQVPDAIHKKLKAHFTTKTLFFLRQAREVSKLSALFSKHGILAIPYKGIILCDVAYEGIGHRTFSDLDFLIHFEDLKKVEKLILERGYNYEFGDFQKDAAAAIINERIEYNFDYFEGEQRIFHFEPHWELTAKMSNKKVTIHDMASMIEERPFLGTSIPQFTVEGMILTTTLHHAGTDYWRKLRQLLDIALLVQHSKNVDWNTLQAEAERLDLTEWLAAGLQLADELWDLKTKPEHQFLPKFDKWIDLQIPKLATRWDTHYNIVLERFQFVYYFEKNTLARLKLLKHFIKLFFLGNAVSRHKQQKNISETLFSRPIQMIKKYINN